MIEWPSDRVKPGGIFHLRKATYSKDTQDLLKVLMDEAKLTILQRKQINYHLRNGNPLPVVEDEAVPQRTETIPQFRFVRKRNLGEIKASGAYDFEQIPFGPYKEPCHQMKQRLQDAMSGLNSSNKQKKPKRVVKNYDQISELLEEIKERSEWIDEMDKLGEGRKYRDMIKNQIAEKLREIKRLEKLDHERESEEHFKNQFQ